MSGIKKNFVYLSSYKILEMLLPMITSPLLSRRLGAAALGVYAYATALVGIFIVLGELGVYRYGMREIAKVRDNRELLNQTYSDIYTVHVINGGCVLVIYYIYVLFLSGSDNRNVLMVVGLGILGNMIDNAFFYVGCENIKALTLRDAVTKLAAFTLIVLVVRSPGDLILYACVMSISAVFSKVWGLVFCRRYVSFVRPDRKNCIKHYRPMAILMIPAVSAVIYQSMDRIMIGQFYHDEDVGFYECASKALIPRNLITVMGSVLCPAIASLYGKGRMEEAAKKVKRSFILSMILAYVFMCGISAIAREFAPWFWGGDFAVCSGLLVGLSVSIPFWTVGEVVRNQYLLPLGRDNEYMLSFVSGVAVNAVANILLIPDHGALGAVFATIMAEFTMSAIQTFMVKRTLPVGRYLLPTLPYFLFSMVMYLSVRCVAVLIRPGGVLSAAGSMFDGGMAIVVEVVTGVFVFGMLVLVYELGTKRQYLLPLVLEFLFKRKG